MRSQRRKRGDGKAGTKKRGRALGAKMSVGGSGAEKETLGELKCRHHDHIEGAYVGTAHLSCNLTHCFGDARAATKRVLQKHLKKEKLSERDIQENTHLT